MPAERPPIPAEVYAYFGKTAPAPQAAAPGAVADVVPITRNSEAYVDAAYRAEIAELSGCGAGRRNDLLNVVALKLARLPVDRVVLRNDLVQACLTNGLVRDDGHRSVEDTIASAFARADADGPRPIPDCYAGRPDVVEVDPETLLPASAGGRDIHLLNVTRKAYELQVADEARRLYASRQAALLGRHAPVPQSLTQFLAVPDTDAVYRIDGVLPRGGRALLAAQYKTGKTTMMANLLRCLADGAPFLGRYRTEAATRITLLDTELDERMLRRWLRTQTIATTDAISVVSLRGHVASFDILDERTRAEWAQRLAGTEILILDCLRPCIDALGLSEDKDAGKFLVAFDALLAAAGATEAVVVHHMGHQEERSRGDSRLLDWPDVLWKIVRDRDDEGRTDDAGDRYFSAMGRDVQVAESLLDYTPETGSLMVAGGSRSDKKARGIFEEIVEILSDPANSGGLSFTKLVSKLKARGNSRDNSRKAIRMALADAVLVSDPGSRGADVYTLNPSRPR